MELLTKLGIDWKLLVAQIVNFTILLSILSSFAYRPLLRLLDERRERIRKALEDAKRIEQEKQALEEWKLEQMRKFDQEAGAFLERAKRQAEETRGEIIATAKREVETMLAKGRAELQAERARVATEVQGSLAELILRLTEKILEREFGPSDQERLLRSLEREIPLLLQR
jgi:F-type H+-transporting ATPase subunit b